MNHTILVIIGAAAWLGGVGGLMILNRNLPIWSRITRSVKFKVTGEKDSDVLFALFQVVGIFWVIAGLGFWLIGDAVNPASMGTLFLIVCILPVAILMGASIRPK